MSANSYSGSGLPLNAAGALMMTQSPSGRLTQTADGLSLDSDIPALVVSFDASQAAYAAQATWYVDPVSGVDTASGLTSLAPLRTHEEIRRRIGSAPICQPTSIFLMGDMPDTDPVWVFFQLGVAASGLTKGSLRYVGQHSTTLYTGAVTAVTALNRAMNQAWEIEDTAIPVGWIAAGLLNTATDSASASDIAKRIRITSGARVGAVSWAVKEITATSTKLARTGQFSLITTDFGQGISGGLTTVTPVIGDPFVVETLCAVSSLMVDLRGPALVKNADDPGTDGVLMFVDLSVNPLRTCKPVFRILSGNLNPAVEFNGCGVGRVVGTEADVITGFFNCRFGGAVFDGIGGRLLIGAGVFVGITMRNLPGPCVFQIRNDFLVQGCAFNLLEGGILYYDNMGVFDSGTSGIRVRPGAVVHASGGTSAFYGGNNTSYGISVQPGGTFLYITQKPVIAGLVNDTIVGGLAKAYAAIPFFNGYDGITVGTGNAAQISLEGTF